MSYTNLDLVEEYAINDDHKGIRAKDDLPAGTLIGIYDGEIKPYAIKDGRLVDDDAYKEIVQIAIVGGTLLALVSHPDGPFYGIDVINHSCEPNVIVRDRIVLQTSRVVAAGEQLTVDYRKWDFIPEGIPCWCSPSRCIF